MEINVQRLDRQQFASLYGSYMTEDFEGHGLKPLAMIQKMVDQNTYDCLGMYVDGELKGYACLVREPERGYFLLDYFAVCSFCRDLGYGGRFLEKLREYYGEARGIFLESESVCAAPDEGEEQVCMRRIRFYRKQGCRHTQVKSWLFGHEYDIFYIPLKEKDPDIQEELDRIYRLMGLEKLYGGAVRIWSRRSRLLGVHAWSGAVPDSSGKELPQGAFWTERPSLVRALMPSGSLPAVISLVGGGGKTTTMYQLADELAEQGKRVLVTTSTHMGCPKEGECQYARISHIREVKDISWKGNILTVGKCACQEEAAMVEEPSGHKLGMPDGLGEPEAMEELLGCADVVLIEADGARLLPVKIPEAWEPVIIPQTGMVIACAGLSALGQTFGDACFRFGSAGGGLRRRSEDVMELEDLALILMDERGAHRQVAGRYYRIVLNQADNKEKRDQAAGVLRALPVTMQSGCVVTAYSRQAERKL